MAIRRNWSPQQHCGIVVADQSRRKKKKGQIQKRKTLRPSIHKAHYSFNMDPALKVALRLARDRIKDLSLRCAALDSPQVKFSLLLKYLSCNNYFF